MTPIPIKSAVLLAAAATCLAQQFTISTFAGGAPPATPAPALEANIGYPQGLVTDATGNIYFNGLNSVFKLDPSGTLTVVAGNGRQGFSGDGGPATEAQLSLPLPYANSEGYTFSAGLAVTPSGDLLIADIGNSRIRKVSQGIITTVAGGGNCSASCDGQPATNVWFWYPSNLVLDSAGNFYFVSGDIYKVTPAGMVTHLYSASWTSAIALDPSGDIYFAQVLPPQVSRLAPDGTVTRIAGNGTYGYTGDGGPATSAQLLCPYSLAIDLNGNLIIGDFGNGAGYGAIRRVTSDGNIATLAGQPWHLGEPAFNPSGFSPSALVFDAAGDLLIADTGNSRIRKLSNSLITNVAGSDAAPSIGDGGPASKALLANPFGLAHDINGNLYVADAGNARVRRVSPDGTIVTVAGNGTAGYAGDGAQATAAQITAYSLAVDLAGNLYIAGDAVVRKVTPGGIISTFAGGGVSGYSGDGGPANAAQLGRSLGVAVDHSGDIYIADASAARLRKVSTDGIITTIAGNGTNAPVIDGPVATNSPFAAQALAIDAGGDIYAGVGTRVYKISAGGIISAVTGGPGLQPTGPIPARAAAIGTVSALAFDAAHNLFVADSDNGMVYRISPGGVMEPVAGSGYETYGPFGDIIFYYSGDGGPALSAQFAASSLAVDGASNVYVSDSQNNAIRKLAPRTEQRRPY